MTSVRQRIDVSAPTRMRVVTCAVSVLLAFVVHGFVWSGVGTGSSVLRRPRLPAVAREHDISWLPAWPWVAIWLALAGVIVFVARIERDRDDRFEPWSLFAALLAGAGLATAARGVRFAAEMPDSSHCSSVFDLAFIFCGAAMLAAIIALARIALPPHHKGVMLTLGALLIPPGAMWFVVEFLVAPLQFQPGGLSVELATVPHCTMWNSVSDSDPVHAVELQRLGDSLLLHDPASGEAKTLDHIGEIAALMNQAPLSPTGEGPLAPDDPLLVVAAEDTPGRHVFEVLDKCREVGIWKIFFAVRQESKGRSGFLLAYLPRGTVSSAGPTVHVEHAGLQVIQLAADATPDLAWQLARAGSSSSHCRVEAHPALPWGVVMHAASALVEDGRIWWPTRLGD